MPGSANPMFSAQDVVEANKFVKDIIDRSMKSQAAGVDIPRLIRQHMSDVGAEVYYHTFPSHANNFNPVHFFSSIPKRVMTLSNISCTSHGVNSVGIIRAPRGDGKETIVLVTPYNPESIEQGEALSLGLAFSVFSLLSQVTWLAKDIIWLAADSRFGEYTSVDTWLKDYHNLGFFVDPREADVGMCLGTSTNSEGDKNLAEGMKSNVFKRAGTMAAALVFKVVEKKEIEDKDSLTIYAEASNGQMPNLDLINVVHYLAVYRHGLRVQIGRIGSLLGSAWLKLVGEILHGLGKYAAMFNPNWKLDVTSSDYADGTATLASSMYYQALGVPTGPHGAFRDYQVDAITLELSPRTFLNNKNAQSAFLLKSGRLIEGIVRSVNNLLEKFHQSFFLYFLTAPNKFVSVGVYMIAFALLISPLPIVAAALFSGSKQSRDSTDSSNPKGYNAGTDEDAGGPWKWIHSAKVVFMIHLWAVSVSLLPYFVSQIPDISPTESMLAWVGLSIVILLVFYLITGSPYTDSKEEWKVLKAVTIATASIGLSLMSIINFSTAQIGALLVAPMCLMVRPLRNRDLSTGLGAMLLVCNVILGVVGFPPVALMILKSLFGGVGIGDFWLWAEFLWAWNSVTYVYLLLVHLPCWVLCIHILLHA